MKVVDGRVEFVDIEEIDFYQIYNDAISEYEDKKGDDIDNDDYPEYILFAMEKVYKMTKNGEI